MSDGGGPRLSDRQRLHWLRLIRTPNVGAISFRELINRFGSAEAAIAALPELAARGGARRQLRVPPPSEAEAELETAERHGARFVAVGEPDYPPLLRQDAPPPLIAVRGRGEVLRMPAISMVGARNASAAGTRMARMLAADFGRAGYDVVSGLARGIDTAAHRGALATGTVAVMAGGLDRPYPPENHDLFEEIAARGAVLSEMPFGWEARARDFPRRNRLIAGIGFGLVVVEAARRSGSLITARLANEMGRAVFAVPGSPLDPRAQGPNGLIKEGATLITEAADVLDALSPQTQIQRAEDASFQEPSDYAGMPGPDDADRTRVVEALGTAPVPLDDIIRHTGLHPAQVMTALLELDLAGRLQRHPGGALSLLVADP